MRSSLRAGVVSVVLFATNCQTDGDVCGSDGDCTDGQRCHPTLGCVPDVSDADGDADTDADADADADADTDADADADPECDVLFEDCLRGDEIACRSLHELCPGFAADCESLRMLCEAQDRPSCDRLATGGCDSPDPCGANGSCADCPDDPDCAGSICDEMCGPLPESATEYCVWSCDEAGQECRLAPNTDAPEQCELDGGMFQLDEDCDGLVDCEDPDCAEICLQG